MTRQEWLQWRKLGLGSSDYPIIMGEGGFEKTLHDVYLEKIDPDVVEDETNAWIKDRGNRIEPRVRSLWELHTGKSYEPALCVMDGFEHMRVSLDGRTEDKTEGAEIKLSGKADWIATKEQKIVPKKYFAQVQGQILVANLKRCWYLSYRYEQRDDKSLSMENLAYVEVLPDREYQARLLEACGKFWFENVLKRKPPILSDKDFKPLTGIADAARAWIKLGQEIELLSKKQAAYREMILEAAKATGHPRLMCAGIKILQIASQGSVQWDKIPGYTEAMKAFETISDQYRAPGRVSWRMDPPKEEKCPSK